MIKLYKPSGQEIEVNKDSLKFALGLGWTEKKPTSKKKQAKKAD